MKKIHDEFFFRKSLFTPSMYFSFSDNMIIDNKKFQLAIYLNSPILYQSIFMVEEKLKKSEEILHKYFSRCCFRNTPFGYFSGVGKGEFGEKSSEEIIATPYLNVDSNWINKIVQLIENDSLVFSKLYVYHNINLTQEGEYYHVLCPFITSGEPQYKIIKRTDLLSKIVDVTGKPIKIELIVNLLLKSYEKEDDDLFKEKLESYIKKLLAEGFLISTLRNETSFKDHLSILVGELENIGLCQHELFIKLLNLEKLIKSFNEENNKTLGRVKQIDVHAQSLLNEQPVLFADTLFSEIQLPVEFKHNVERTSNVIELFMFKNNYDIPYNNIVSFIQKRYSEFDFIPLTELLFSDFSLQELDILPKQSEEEDIESILGDLQLRLQRTQLRKEKELVLEDDYIEWLSKKRREKLDINYDLTLKFYEFNGKDIVEFENRLSGGQVCSLMGRFLYLFNDSRIVDSYLKERYKDIVGYSVVNSISPSNNLGLSIPIFKNNISIDTQSNDAKLFFKDISVTLVDGCITLINNNTLKNVGVGQLDSLNVLNMGRISQFLFLMSNELENSSFSIFHLLEKRFNLYIPRIRYRNIILAPAKFAVSKQILGVESLSSFNEFKSAVNKWKKEFDVPRFIKIELENVMLVLDLENELDLSEIFKQLNKRESEYILWGEEYFCGKAIENITEMESIDYTFHILNTNERLRSGDKIFPVKSEPHKIDNNTLSMKIYLRKEYVNRTLDIIYEFIESRDFKFKLFFIVYSDPKFHLRIRFQLKDCYAPFKFVEELKLFLRDRISISQIVIDEFFPEINRYGGEKYSPIVYNYFCEESNLIAELNKKKYSEVEYLNIIFDIFDMLSDVFQIKEEKLIRVLQELHEHRTFETVRNNLKKMLNTRKCYRFHAELKIAIDKLMKYSKNIEGEPEKIMTSMFHMLINRFSIFEIPSEQEIYALYEKILIRRKAMQQDGQNEISKNKY
ncbi:thiopeptide-type bacteriocin biosynthesis protein [Granulicatella sp. 20925_1_45]|uniref:thiopeptide-type bacteriocin biosynthesis protein n=1 Tax=Granulicatella sp. 20925_1_45 TaxID=3003685 RepID=UPI00352D15A3